MVRKLQDALLQQEAPSIKIKVVVWVALLS